MTLPADLYAVMQLTAYFQKTSLGFDEFVMTNTTLLDSTFENWGVNCITACR
jgi:hypothetical protein